MKNTVGVIYEKHSLSKKPKCFENWIQQIKTIGKLYVSVIYMKQLSFKKYLTRRVIMVAL